MESTEDKVSKISKAIILISIGVLLGCGIIFGTLFYKQNNISYSKANEITLLNGDYECSNLSLEKTAICLNKDFSSWWKYNESNLEIYNNGYGNYINWSVIREQGAVCGQASRWFIDKAKSLGFSGKRINFGEDEGHAYALIWDKNMTSYCIMDQQAQPACFKLGVQNE
jgi:hypothetical protein